MRGWFWLCAWLSGGYVVYSMEVAKSQAAYDAGDLSAFAWRGFLPFIVPVFLMYSGFVIGPIAAATEFILWIYRRKQS